MQEIEGAEKAIEEYKNPTTTSWYVAYSKDKNDAKVQPRLGFVVSFSIRSRYRLREGRKAQRRQMRKKRIRRKILRRKVRRRNRRK
jgi:hypothetical protein